MFTSWFRLIIKTTALRSYKSLFSVLLRLIRQCQSVVNGKERDFQEGSSLALSSQPVANQSEQTPPVSLAVPILDAPPQTQLGTNVQMPTPEPYGGNNINVNVSCYDTRSPGNPTALSTPISFPKPSIPVAVATTPPPTTPPPLTTPGQTFNIILTPIVPESQVKRYERHVPVYVNYTMSSKLLF